MRDEKPSINTVQFESESTVYLGAKIWELIPENIESSESVEKTNKKSRWNVCYQLKVPYLPLLGFTCLFVTIK